jgi:hypothetical protein
MPQRVFGWMSSDRGMEVPESWKVGNVNCKAVQTAGLADEVVLAQLRVSYLTGVAVEGAMGKEMCH